ncbi:ankyrin repeat and LEM domain-containing protein 1 isoform X2 [Alligator mississippiensis]|uniref:ankyrin repeat and LEM domain-containing protein 1 isoform X2 n=1 Tax=Alligator mississippiensis TaxID=8496 RepID=UPI0028772C59|nr:ankyrin repeat and LEM domain-containing protein 1 isoform X2 [Alligator mississippiensis]
MTGLAAQLCEALRGEEEAAAVEALLKQGADPNLVLPEGIAAVHLAAGKERESGVRCLQLILQYGGDPNARSAEELTPLHVAASWGCYKCLKLLLRKGGDPDLEDQDGSRAIDLATEQGNTMCVQILQDFQRARAWPVCLRRPEFSPDGPGRAGSPPCPVTADSMDCSVFSRLSEASSAPPSSTWKWLPDGSPRETGLDVTFPDAAGIPRSQLEPPPPWLCFSIRPDAGTHGQPALPQPVLCSTLLSASNGPQGGAWSLPAAPEEEPAEAEDSLASSSPGTAHMARSGWDLPSRAALRAGDPPLDETVVVHSPRQPGSTRRTPGSASPCESHGPLPSHSSWDTREPCPVPHSLAQPDGFLDPTTGDWEGLDATSPDHAYLFCWAHSTALHDLDKTVMVPASLEKAPEISSGPLESSSSRYSSCDSECYVSTVEASDPAEAGRDRPASKGAWGTGRSAWQCPGKQLVLGPQGQSLKTPALGRAFVQDVPPSRAQLAEVAGGSAGDVCQGAHCFGESGGLRPAGKPALVLHAGSTENSPSPRHAGSQRPTQTPQHAEPVEHDPRQGSNRATRLSLPRAPCRLALADLGAEGSGPGRAAPSGDCRLGTAESATLGQPEGRQLRTQHSPAAWASPRCEQGRRGGQSQASGLSARGSDLGTADTVPLSRATAGTADTVPLSRATAGTADTVPLSRATAGTADTVPLSRATAGMADTVPLSRATAGTADTVPLSRATAGMADTVPLSRATADTVPLSRATADTVPLSRATADTVPLSRATVDTVPLSRAMMDTADTVPLSRATAGTADTVPLSRATASTADTVPLSRATAGTADTVPLSRAGESTDGEESEADTLLLQRLGSLDSTPRSATFANSTGTPRSSSSPPCPVHCHITPRTKSRLNASTARGNSSSSSSLFDETLELPQRPQRVRRPPETSHMPVSPAGGLLESTRASYWEAAGSGSLDETVVLLPVASLPAAPGQSSAPSTNPTALQSPAGVTCLLAPETAGPCPPRMEHPSTAAPPSSPPGAGESSWLTEEDCTECPGLGAPVGPPTTTTSTQDWFGSKLGSGEPSQSLAQGLDGPQLGGKKPSSRSRVSFSRLSAARPALAPPGSGRLSPVPDTGGPGIPLSPGGRPVSHGSGEAVEYLYLDEEEGHALIERHVPPTDDTSCCADTSSEDTIIYDWRACASQRGAKENRPPPAPACSDEALLRKLRKLGADPGPVTDSTRNLYVRQLNRLQSSPGARAGRGATGHSPELSAALETLQIPDCQADEVALAAQFDQPDKARKWREGVLKSSFNYLLLDPRVTQNLPLRCHALSPAERFQTFVRAIFYVGKGKRARPYSHLYEALAHYRGGKKQACAKVRHILDIWAGGQGVVSVHCFQNVIPVEAYTREACMVDALGLAMLTNQKRGNCYGVAAGWPPRRRRRLGVHLLHRALQIFLAEGERQLRPADIQVGQ